ncbi:MAG: RIP metalloprotease RseP [bacterium]
MFITVITFIIVLSVLVLVHELGHFWVARRYGLRPREFGFGFKPRALGIYKTADGKWKISHGSREVTDAVDTIYSINWIPLGGFVDLGEDEEPGENSNHFGNKPIWQRAAILLAGVTMNIVLAMVIFSFGFMVGLPQQLPEDGINGAIIKNHQVQVLEVLPDSPAKSAGLKTGDIILSVDGVKINFASSLMEYTNKRVGDDLTYIIKRGREKIEKKIKPEIIKDTGMGGVGIAIAEIGTVRYPIHLAIWNGIKITCFLTVAIFMAFCGLIKGLFVGQGLGDSIGGPVRIAEVTAQAAQMGFAYLLNFTAILSINLAILNGLPFPALDGGRILFLIIEKIKGRPVKRELEGTIHYIGFALLMVFVVAVTYNDIARHAGVLKIIWSKIF